MTILDGCISLNSVQNFLVVWGVVDMCHLLLKDSCGILVSLKIMVIFNTISADIKTEAADVILKMTTILKEMRIVQLCS